MERQIEKYFQEELNADERLDFLKQIGLPAKGDERLGIYLDGLKIIFRCRLREKDYSRQLHPVLV